MHVIIAMFLSVQILVRTSTGELQAYVTFVEADGMAFDMGQTRDGLCGASQRTSADCEHMCI